MSVFNWFIVIVVKNVVIFCGRIYYMFFFSHVDEIIRKLEVFKSIFYVYIFSLGRYWRLHTVTALK